MKNSKVFRFIATLAIFVGLSASLSSCFYHDYHRPRYERHYNHGGYGGGHHGGGHYDRRY